MDYSSGVGLLQSQERNRRAGQFLERDSAGSWELGASTVPWSPMKM